MPKSTKNSKAEKLQDKNHKILKSEIEDLTNYTNTMPLLKAIYYENDKTQKVFLIVRVR
jgi:hypothetical protein